MKYTCHRSQHHHKGCHESLRDGQRDEGTHGEGEEG